MEGDKEEVADSPQSGEMVIDENPQGGKRTPNPAQPPRVSPWGHVPPPNKRAMHGYEPNCEPVSDDE